MPELGAFGVTATPGWKARVIRLVTHSTVNHAFIYVGNGQIVEANPSGAALAPVSKYPAAIWSTGPPNGQAVADAARSLIGTPYSWVDVVCVGLADIFDWHVAAPVRRRLNRRDRLDCSQLVDTAYLRAGIHLFPDGRVPGDVAPADLLNLIHEGAHLPT
jgi:cell wall-associated NlpC family hydrolase